MAQATGIEQDIKGYLLEADKDATIRHYRRLIYLLMAGLVIASIGNGFIVYEELKLKFMHKMDLAPNCNYTSLRASVVCMVSEVSEFYKYNITETEHITLEQLKDTGGDCKHYSQFYADYGERLGYTAKTVSMVINKTDGHRIALLTSANSYCIIDQLNYWCAGVG